MLIKEAKYKTVSVEQRREVSPAVYGCDECRAEIKEWPNEDYRLEVKVFHNDNREVDDLHFCSWECVFAHLPKIQTDHFVTLPYILFDAPPDHKRGAAALMKLLKRLTSKAKQ